MCSVWRKIANKYYFIDKKISISIVLIFYFINLLSIKNFFLETNNLKINIIDYILYLFNDFYFIFFLSYILISVFMFRIYLNSDIDEYIYIRYRNRNRWLINRILYISVCVLVFIMMLLFVNFIQLFIYFKGIATWTDFGENYFSNIYSIVKSPIIAVVISISLVYLYLFSLSLIAFTGGLFFKKKIYGFFFAVILNLLNMLIYLNGIKSISEISFCTNTILLYQYNRQIQFDKIVFSVVYWLIIIAIAIILSLIRIKNIDLDRGKK